MSRIDELIQEFCPEGVGSKLLGEVCTIKTGQPVSKVLISKNPGEYPVINSGREPLGFIDKSNTEDDPIGITSRGAGVGSVTWCPGKYYRGNLNYSVTIKDKRLLDVRFLYFLLMQNQPDIQRLATYQGIPALNKSNLEKLQIPIPPLEVQKEIVNILDKFTQLEAELSAELEARRKQYKYYRSQLLTFDNTVRWATIANVMSKTSGTKVTAQKMKELHKEGAPVKIFAGGKTYAYFDYSDLPEKDVNTTPSVVVKSRGIIEFEYIDTPFSHKNEFWSYSSKDENVNTKYVYYVLKNNEPHFQRLGGMMQMPQISSGDTNNFKIPIPSLDEQNRIVAILDKFDNLTNSIAEGLPAEIKARRKQYEYYRTKLLTFQELPV